MLRRSGLLEVENLRLHQTLVEVNNFFKNKLTISFFLEIQPTQGIT